VTSNLSLGQLGPTYPTTLYPLEGTLAAAAPRQSISADFSKLLRSITSKAISQSETEKLSPQTFVNTIRLIAALEQNPSMIRGWIEGVRKLGLIGELALQNPSSELAKPLITLALQKRPELKVFADPNLVNTALNICEHASDNGLFARGVSKEKITTTLKPPLEEALETFLKEYGKNKAVNDVLKEAGLKSNAPLTPLETLLERYR